MKVIAITGGPCAGKTTALDGLKAALEQRGWAVAVVPEAATTLISGGVAPWTVGATVNFQVAVFRLQRAQEDVFRNAAKMFDASDKVVVVCDRGLMDGKSYILDEEFEDILAMHGTNEDEVLARYDAVFHLESAAKGTQGAYTLENNATRKEDPAEACRVDDRTMQVWARHAHRCIIGNEEFFETKVLHLVNEVLAFLEGRV